MVSLKRDVHMLSQSTTDYHDTMEGLLSNKIKIKSSHYQIWIAYLHWILRFQLEDPIIL